MTSDNAGERRRQPAGSTSDNTEPAASAAPGPEPVGMPTEYGVAFHYCAALGDPPACGRVQTSALLRHVALPAADVPADLRCRNRRCRTAYDALDAGAGR